jgi:type I restriction enzyme M protein
MAYLRKIDVKKRLDADAGMAEREKALAKAVESWWKQNQGRFTSLPKTQALMPLRAYLLSSFEQEIGPVGLLDRFQVTGVIATWWDEVQNNLKTLAAQGFRGLVEAWTASIVSTLEDEKSKENPLDHALTKHLLPQYLVEISELEAKKAELETAIQGGEPSEDEEDDEEEEGDEKLSEEEVKALKKELGSLKKKLKALQDNFKMRLEAAVAKLDDASTRALVLGILREDLDAIIVRYVMDHRQQVVAAFDRWWEKYRVTLISIQQERDAVAERVKGFLKGLKYV